MIVGFLFVSAFAFSQNIYTTMQPVMDSMQSVIKIVEANKLEIVRIEMDIVRKDVPKTSFRILTKGYTYRVGVFADWRLEDVDIEIYKQMSDGNYVFVGRDNKVSPIAMVDFTTEETTWYKFVVIGYKFVSPYDSGHYGLVVLHGPQLTQ